VIPDARLQPEDGDVLEIRADGSVLEDGDLLFTVDRAGRVYDEDREPVALLLPDGYVAGSDDVLLGRVGLTNASPPGRATAWLSMLPDGTAIYFDPDGERSSLGVWRGCAGAGLRTCTLVTHLVMLGRAQAARRDGVSLGVGVGVGVWH